MQEDDFLGNPLSLLLPRSFWISIQPAVKITVCVCVCVCVSRSVLSNSFNPMDDSLPGSSVHGILQTRILEWVASPSSRESS